MGEQVLHELDEDLDGQISALEFAQMLTKEEVIWSLNEIGVDVEGVVDMTEYVFAGRDKVAVHEFADIILELRSNNFATVKDVINLRRHITLELSNIRLLVSKY